MKTDLGEVTGYNLKKQLYVNADDVTTLFGVNGGLENISEKSAGKIFRLRTTSAPIEPVKPVEPVQPETPPTSEPEKTETVTPAPENDSEPKETVEKVQTQEPEGEVIETVVIEEVVG